MENMNVFDNPSSENKVFGKYLDCSGDQPVYIDLDMTNLYLDEIGMSHFRKASKARQNEIISAHKSGNLEKSYKNSLELLEILEYLSVSFLTDIADAEYCFPMKLNDISPEMQKMIQESFTAFRSNEDYKLYDANIIAFTEKAAQFFIRVEDLIIARKLEGKLSFQEGGRDGRIGDANASFYVLVKLEGSNNTFEINTGNIEELLQ